MLKLIAVLLAAAIVVGGATLSFCATSQPPTPSASEQRGAEQKPAQSRDTNRQTDDRGTEKRPFVVETHAAPQSKSEAEKDAAYQEQRTTNDRILAVGVASIIVGALQTLALVVTFLVIAFVAVRQLRAYVYPGVTSVKEFRLPGPVVIVVEMNNSGQTPAREFRCHGNSFLAALPIGGDNMEHPKGEAPSIGPLYPNDLPNTVEFECIDQLVPAAIAGLKKPEPEVAIYVAGEIHYRDIFWRKRMSQFCRYIEPDDAKWLIGIQEGTAHWVPERIIRFTTAHMFNKFK